MSYNYMYSIADVGLVPMNNPYPQWSILPT